MHIIVIRYIPWLINQASKLCLATCVRLICMVYCKVLLFLSQSDSPAKNCNISDNCNKIIYVYIYIYIHNLVGFINICMDIVTTLFWLEKTGSIQGFSLMMFSFYTMVQRDHN